MKMTLFWRLKATFRPYLVRGVIETGPGKRRGQW